MKKNVEGRLLRLEATRQAHDDPAWVVFQDGEEVPEGVKGYHASIDPDLWDKDDHEKTGRKKITGP
jgi:hypothetical protein